MILIRTAFAVLLATTSVTALADCPVGESLAAQERPRASSISDQSRPPTYRLAGELSDGTQVLHAVDRRQRTAELHEVLLVKRASQLQNMDGESVHPVTLGGEDYVIEKLESVTVDEPCGGIVSVEGNNVVLTIAAP